jgi:hypothetical protein
MVYGIVMNSAAPAEAYDALHAEVVRRGAGTSGALLVHLGHATAGGFQIIEVWRSEEEFRRFSQDVVMPILVELFGAEAAAVPPDTEEFEVRGLMVQDDRTLV